jgi:Protein of unknown function (DUF1360)
MLSEAPALTMHYSFRFVLAALAVWRLTHLISREDGPWGLLRKFRSGVGRTGFGKLISCFYCVSVWASLPFAWFVGGSVLEMIVGWWAISGAAVLLERATREPFEFSLEENEDGLLRQDKRGADSDQPERYR